MRPKSWTHDRESFYKYMSASTAKIVLRNQTLRWSSPILFNDPFDVQFDLHTEYDRQRVADRAMQILVDGYMGKAPISTKNALGRFLQMLRDRVPGISEEELRKKLFPGFFEGMARGERRVPEAQAQFRAVMADLRILCLTEVHDNILMWSHYGVNHTGVVIELKCVEELDSAWGAAKPVRYEKNMPLLLDEDQLVAMMTGAGVLANEDLFENSVFVKAVDWAYEREWRLVGGRDKTKLTEDFGFNTKELATVFLGCRISEADRAEVLGILKERFPDTRVQQGRKSERQFALEFAVV